jgi:DinB superfamily
MQDIALDLESTINQHFNALGNIPEDTMIYKPAPGKWSKKEIIGHLIDSAESNIRRFVVAQYEEKPHIVYNQDKWVQLCNYQQWKTTDLVMLWYLLNKQICAILKNTPTGLAGRQVQTESLNSIEWLAKDYIKHLSHHLHQVLELEPIAYP